MYYRNDLSSAIQVQSSFFSHSLIAVFSISTFCKEDSDEIKELGIQAEKKVFSGEGRMRGWDFESIQKDVKLMVPTD